MLQIWQKFNSTFMVSSVSFSSLLPNEMSFNTSQASRFLWTSVRGLHSSVSNVVDRRRNFLHGTKDHVLSQVGGL